MNEFQIFVENSTGDQIYVYFQNNSGQRVYSYSSSLRLRRIIIIYHQPHNFSLHLKSIITQLLFTSNSITQDFYSRQVLVSLSV